MACNFGHLCLQTMTIQECSNTVRLWSFLVAVTTAQQAKCEDGHCQATKHSEGDCNSGLVLVV
jgi:hypothetical protein